MRKTRSSRCISSRMAAPKASLYVMTGMLCRGVIGLAMEIAVVSSGDRFTVTGCLGRRIRPRLAVNRSPGTVHVSSRRRIRVHVLVKRLHGQLWAGLGEVPRVLHGRLELLVELVELVVGELTVFLHVVAQERDGIALHVLLELRLGAVGAAHRVGHGVSHEAVGPDLEERRDLLLPRALD